MLLICCLLSLQAFQTFTAQLVPFFVLSGTEACYACTICVFTGAEIFLDSVV